MRTSYRFAALAMTIALAACSEGRPPAPTAEQTDQLNEAEDLLDEQARNEEGPAPEGTGPSDLD